MARNDIHKPSLLDPAEYDFIAAFYQGDSHWIAEAYNEEHEVYEQALADCNVFMGNFFHKNTCDHCGAAFNHGVCFLHIPTDELVRVGHICASETVGLPDRAAKARKTAEKFARVMKAREEQHERTQAWRDENAEIVTWLAAQDMNTAHNFICDMQRTIEKWGALSTGQAQAVRKWMANDEKRAVRKAQDSERLSNAPALAEGRREITGEVISTKWSHGQFGEVLKMLVQEADGNRVYGTVPSALEGDVKGRTVNFTAKVQRSEKDDHFGFFSRPNGARFV